MSKSILQIIYSCSVQKTARKNTKYSRNESILELGYRAKAIAHGKWSLCSKIKIPIDLSKSNLQIIQSCPVQKTAGKKHEIFQKSEHFENRLSWKGYSLWKMVRLAEKLKFQTTCQNPFYKSFRVVLCKKTLEKTRNIPEMRAFWNSAIVQRLQPMENGQFASKIKIRKDVSKSILQII